MNLGGVRRSVLQRQVVGDTEERQRFCHDVHQSLATISVLASALLLETDLSGEGRRRLELLRDEVRSVQELAQLSLHREPVAFTGPVALDEVVQGVLDVLAEVRSTTLDLRYEKAYVNAARPDVRRVVGNLLQNACNAAGPNGKVVAEVLNEGRHVVLQVSDSGPGFGQAQTSGKRFGLTIVRSLVARAGGTIEIRTGPLGGAQVVVMFPRAEREWPTSRRAQRFTARRMSHEPGFV